jgi:hypothetical protein
MMLVEDADPRCGLCRLHNGALLILGSLTGALGCRGGFEAALFGIKTKRPFRRSELDDVVRYCYGGDVS